MTESGYSVVGFIHICLNIELDFCVSELILMNYDGCVLADRLKINKIVRNLYMSDFSIYWDFFGGFKNMSEKFYLKFLDY